MTCRSKISNRCGSKTPSGCVSYELEVPEFSSLDNEDCLSVEDTTKDIYEILGQIKEQISIEDVNLSECLAIEAEDKESFSALLNKIIAAVEAVKCPEEPKVIGSDINLEAIGVEIDCLVDKCSEEPITKLSQLLTTIVARLCDEDTPETLINGGNISLLKKVTFVRTTVASTYDLEDGRESQTKMIKMTQDGGDATINVVNLNGGTTITMNDEKDFVYLMFAGGEWNIITNSGCTIA